ncbi:MAG: hypothetical protein OXP69_22135 [Spirochaetaceae bacterium]|nr:hypothetical protein [Spirochaetaceae bacterium]
MAGNLLFMVGFVVMFAVFCWARLARRTPHHGGRPDGQGGIDSGGAYFVAGTDVGDAGGGDAGGGE